MKRLIIILLLLVPALTAAQDFTCVKQSSSTYNHPTVKHTAFTVSYNTETLCPDWVAWELSGTNLQKSVTSRIDEFLQDPDISKTPHTSAYSHSGFDRGHMAPAADFKWSEQAMKESFYTSNVCPQTNTLNAGDWLTLEKACRRWAKYYNTIWIVCGPLHSRTEPCLNSGVKVPYAFFKVVLKKFKGKYYAMGWIMPNNDNTAYNPLKDYEISVNQIEELTGLDFFSDLPDNMEEEIESSTDTTYWQ